MLVTIVEVSDSVPSVANKTIDSLMKGKYGKIWRRLLPQPVCYNRAEPAAIAAEAAGRQGKFWEMHDKLFANYKTLTDANFDKWAGEIGLDMDKFKADLKDSALSKKVKAQQAAAVKLGARGTPAFFINGRFLSEHGRLAKFEEVIEKALKDAQKQIKKGVAPKDVYAKIIEKGATSSQQAGTRCGEASGSTQAAGRRRARTCRSEELPGKGAWPAKVVIVEYSDFECPFCSRGAKTVEDILKEPRQGRLLHLQAQPAGFPPQRRARCACGGSGWDAG